MQSQWQPAGSLGTNVLVAVGVVATILMAFLLAASDDLQMRLPPPPPTQVAAVTEDGVTPTFTAIPPTVVLPTETATGIPASPTVTAEKKPSATPVPVRATCGVIPEDWVAYEVWPGDTLFRLAVNSGATVSALTAANCLESTRLYAGMTLYLPLEPPSPPICSGPPSDWDRYTVQRGDTLFSLARAHGSTVYGVMSANCMVSTRINADQIIYLPALAPAPTATATDVPPPPPTEPPPPPPTEPPPPTATNPPAPTATEPPPPTVTEPPPPTATAPPPTATSPPPTATAPLPSTDTPTPPPDEDGTPPVPTPTATPQPTSTPPPDATATATSEPPPTATGTRLPPDDEATATPPLPDP